MNVDLINTHQTPLLERIKADYERQLERDWDKDGHRKSDYEWPTGPRPIGVLVRPTSVEWIPRRLTTTHAFDDLNFE